MKVKINGLFNCSVNSELRKVYEQLDGVRSLDIDMSEVPALCTSTIGQLLVFQNRVKKFDVPIEITNCPPEMAKSFKNAGLHHLMDIKETV